MSRAERRAYKRLTKNQDPYALPPAAQRGRPPRPRPRPSGATGEFNFWSGRFLVWAIGGSAVAGLLGLSLAWPSGMPFAGYVGIAAAGVALVVAWAVRLAQQRAAARPTSVPR